MRIKIEKLIFEGFGLGRGESGKPFFVRKSVPEDELEIEVIKNKKNYAEGVIKKVIFPSSKRMAPICASFELCGGCEHLNISYNDQLEFKNKIFREIFGRAKINKMPLPIISGSKDYLFYRNSIRFFFVNTRNGIHFARHNYIYNKGLVEISECFLQSKISNVILNKLTQIFDGKDMQTSLLWQLKIREGKAANEFMVEIITSGDSLPEEKTIVNTLRQIPEIRSIYHTIAPGKSLKNLKRRLVFGSPVIYEKIGKYKFQISPESFFQTNSLGVHTLYETIRGFSDVKMGENILDLYCGTGSIGIYLSTMAKSVTGVEVVPEAINDAIGNAKINNVHNCEFIAADAGKYLLEKKNQFDLIIVDPPRAGLNKDIIERLSKTNSRIVYTSCNPATFARDIKTFEELGRRLVKVQPIDMFPQTHHIECVGLIK